MAASNRPPETPLLLTIERAAELTMISRSHAYQLLNAGVWPSVTMGRSRRIPAAWLARWVEAQVQDWARGKEA